VEVTEYLMLRAVSAAACASAQSASRPSARSIVQAEAEAEVAGNVQIWNVRRQHRRVDPAPEVRRRSLRQPPPSGL
jgi:hypothetical protein